jgi:vacuolar iron transporter family protein
MKDKYKSLHHKHDPRSIQKRLQQHSKSLLKDFVYGAIDGIVTTFAIVAGVVGAGLETRTILVLGFANILADGFSMAASNYLGTKAELEEKNLVIDFEQEEIERHPKGEIEELRQIFINKGIEGEALELIVQKIASNKQEWIKLMLAEEYGLGENQQVPWKAGLMTFTAFTIFGLIPLLPYLLDLKEDFSIAVGFTGVAFFAVGAVKSKWTKKSPWLSGLETLAIGAIAAVIAYAVGIYLGS